MSAPEILFLISTFGFGYFAGVAYRQRMIIIREKAMRAHYEEWCATWKNEAISQNENWKLFFSRLHQFVDASKGTESASQEP